MIPMEHTSGLGWARFFAWTALGLGVACLAVALAVPLAGQFGRVAFTAFFGSFAIWAGLMAVPRFRAERHPVSWAAIAGVVLGGLTLALMCYAMLALILASYGTMLPMLPSWTAGSTGSGTLPGINAAG